VVCWESDGQDGSDWGIYGKYYLPDPIVHDLTEFGLIQPGNSDTLNTVYLTFFWNKATNTHFNFPWELSYNLYFSADENFTNPLITPSIFDTTFYFNSFSPGQTYFWKVLAKNINGDSRWSSNTHRFFISPDAKPSSIEDKGITQPDQFSLEQNYPNPFNPSTTIPIILPNKSHVTINVYNTLGQKVANIVHDQSYLTGRHEFTFDGSNLASGVYIIDAQIISEKKLYHFNKKMLLLR
jgi:hypothetical protein